MAFLRRECEVIGLTLLMVMMSSIGIVDWCRPRPYFTTVRFQYYSKTERIKEELL